MGNDQQRYAQMDKMMTRIILADAFLFLLYFIFSALGIIWLKVILTLFVVAISGFVLWFLYTNRELTKPRSLWMTTAAVCILVCLLFSLLLNYPA